MSVLVQQELLEAPPGRRLIVPAGEAACWGVDGSTLRVSIGAVYGAGGGLRRDVRTMSFPRVAGPARLAAIFNATRELAFKFAASVPPGVVLVEQPSGSMQKVNHELEYAVGVIQAAVFDGVYQALGHGVTMETCVASWWKRVACGSGAIKKTHRVEGRKRPVALPLEDYAVMKWARLNGYRGGSWDEADALAIAEAARREIALEER